MALPDTVVANAGLPGHNPPHKYTKSVYYFDASDAGPTDTDSNWTLEADAFDGDIGTESTGTAQGSVTSKALVATGTNAPASGGTITGVTARMYNRNTSSANSAPNFEIKHSSDVLLATGVGTSQTASTWANWYTLSAPTGGWTWAKIQALQVTIWGKHSTGATAIGRVEIEVEVDGAYYVTDGAGFNVWKNSNPGTDSWVFQDSTNNPATASIAGIASISDGTYIHFASIESAQLNYHRFDMSTDTWDVVDVQAGDLSGMDTPDSSVLWCSIAYRSGATDELVIAACGLPDKDMGSAFQRVDLWHADGAVTTAGGWTGPVAIDGSVTGENEVGAALATGTSDGIHIVWGKDSINSPPNQIIKYGRVTFDSSNSFNTATITTPGASLRPQEMFSLSPLLSYDDGGTQRIISNSSTSADTSSILRAVEDGSNNYGSQTRETVTTVDTYITGELNVATLANNGTDLYYIFSGGGTGGVDQDLYYSLSDDGGDTWGTEVEELDGVTINYISAAGLDTDKIAYLYDDGGTTKYGEFDFGSGYSVDFSNGSLTVAGQSIGMKVDREVAFSTGALTLAGPSIDMVKAAHYDVDFTVGALSVAGQSIDFARTYALELSSGSVSLAGQSIALAVGREAVLSTGALTVAGQDINFTKGNALALSTGALTVAGQSVDADVTRKLSINSGALDVAGQDIDLLYSSLTHYSVDFTTDALAIAGQGIDVAVGRSLSLSNGEIDVAGGSINTEVARTLNLSTGALDVAGQDIDLDYASLATYEVDFTTGALTLSGQQVEIAYGRALSLSNGSVSIAGQSVDVDVTREMALSNGSVTLSGSSVDVDVTRELALSTGAVVIAGQDVEMEYASLTNYTVDFTVGTLSIAGPSIDIARGRVVDFSAGAVTVTGPDVSLSRAYAANVQPGSLSVAGPSIEMAVTRNMALSTGALTTTGGSVTIEVARGLDFSVGSLTLAGSSVTIDYDRVLTVESGSVTIAGQLIVISTSANPSGYVRKINGVPIAQIIP